jgi:hypothetical protein
MKIALLALAAATLVGGAAAAQPGRNDPATTIQCLDPGGRSHPATCRVPGGRLDRGEYICQCSFGQPVTVAICPPGVTPPPESRALERARRDAARNGSLLGASFQGRPMCVAPRR